MIAVNRGDILTIFSRLDEDFTNQMNFEMLTHISGDFWVSRIAAIGRPKLEAGPQKSGERNHVRRWGTIMSRNGDLTHAWNKNNPGACLTVSWY